MDSSETDVKSILERYIPVADMIAANFGTYCEVIIHDLQNFRSSLKYVSGNVTGRNPGAPVTDIILRKLRKNGDQVEDMLGFTTRTKDGKILKTSISYIRNDHGKVIGCIGINFDITTILTTTQILNDLSMTTDLNNIEFTSESYAEDIGEIFENIIESTLTAIGTPIDHMKREDKLFFVKQIEEKGVFLINGAVDRISDTLKVSKQTIYNYLDEIRV